MKRIILLLTLILCIVNYGLTQVQTQNKIREHKHEHKQNETGFANTLIYSISDGDFAYAAHLHYIRLIPHSHFGVGLGYERTFGNHQHQTFNIIGLYNPFDTFNIAISPGLNLSDSQVFFALHTELSYEFDLKYIHIGPVIDFAITPHDQHVGLGIHIAYPF